jgi:hypothetical protein
VPNNRQWATLFWIAVIAVLALSRRDVRSALRGFVRSAAEPKILVPLVLMGAWVCLEVWGGAWAALWNSKLFTDTVFWFVSSGLVLFVNFEEASKRSDFFQKKAIAAIAPAVLMESFLDEFTLPLPAEIMLQFALALFVMLAVVASRMEERHRPVATVAIAMVGVIVLGYLATALFQLIDGWSGSDKANLLRQAILPGWLTVGLLPIIYLVALFAAYELAFMRVDHFAGSTRARWPIKLALLTSFHVKATEIASFAGLWPQRLAEAVSFGEARTAIQHFRNSRAEQRRAQAEAQARLVRYTGVDGVDENGRRLDRREFSETTSALRWLSACMMGWYRRQDRYQADLFQRLGDDFVGQGLPKPSGITMRVHDDGQSWHAWRRTVTGWCFAIGAAGPPPEQWEYDGPEPPAGFPGEDPAWGSHAFSDEANRNW